MLWIREGYCLKGQLICDLNLFIQWTALQLFVHADHGYCHGSAGLTSTHAVRLRFNQSLAFWIHGFHHSLAPKNLFCSRVAVYWFIYMVENLLSWTLVISDWYQDVWATKPIGWWSDLYKQHRNDKSVITVIPKLLELQSINCPLQNGIEVPVWKLQRNKRTPVLI